IIFGKPNIKQGQFTSDLKMKGKLSNPKILGDFHIVETNIPFLDTTMKNIEFLFRDKNLEINSKGEILGNDIEAHAILKNDLKKPYHIKNALITTNERNLSSITDKLKYAVAESSQIQDSFGIFDLDSIIADNIVIKADNITLRNLHATNFNASAGLNKQRLFEVKNFIFNIAKGSLSGKYSYNFKNNDINLSMQAESINANDITFAIFDLQNQIYGDLTGSINLSCNGETFEKCMQTLNGDTIFNVKNGKMPKLGSLEYLLKAGNLLKGGITSLSINNVADVISPLKTGEFSDIFGSITIHNGIAENLEITTEGKNLNLFVSGIYDFSTFIADMQVFGIISRKVSSMLGPIGNLSVNSIFNMIPGIDLSKDNTIINKLNRIPGIELSEKAYRKFVADIKGNINGNDYVKSFKWIN
ncbi:MAG: AsmA-like C-terminal region-containing protein, partial [bacterium]|nr:AsmA-like C-terminal region-containing protein [bacterium]